MAAQARRRTRQWHVTDTYRTRTGHPCYVWPHRPGVDPAALNVGEPGYSEGSLHAAASVHSWAEAALRAAPPGARLVMEPTDLQLELYLEAFVLEDPAEWPTDAEGRSAKLAEVLALPDATADLARYYGALHSRAELHFATAEIEL